METPQLRPRSSVPKPSEAPSLSNPEFPHYAKLQLTPDVVVNNYLRSYPRRQYQNSEHSQDSNFYQQSENGDVDRQDKHYTVDTTNGCINIRVPCTHSYMVNAPPQPKSRKNPENIFQKYLPKQKSKCSTEKKFPPFCTTVKGGLSYIPNDGKKSNKSKTQCNTKMIWDYESGKRIPFLAVDYGQELLEQAAANFARNELDKKTHLRGSSDGNTNRRTEGFSSKSSVTSKDTECFDFSKPKYNTSRNTAQSLHKALDDLKNLPLEIEKLVRGDKRFESRIFEEATKALNIHPKAKVYKNLLAVDSNPAQLSKVESKIHDEIKSLQPPSRPRDPEPNIEDFNEINYSRMRPRVIPTPPKPVSGVSINLDHDLHLLNSERKFIEEGDKL